MGTPFDGAGDLVEVELHGLGVSEGQRQGGTRAAGRADGAEQVRAFIALVGRLSWPRSALRPLPHEAVLLADAGLVLEPDLDGLAGRHPAQMGSQRGREVYGMPRPSFSVSATLSGTLRGEERSGRCRLRCLGSIWVRTAAASRVWTRPAV